MRILGLLAGLLLINVSCTLSDSSATKVSIDLSKHQKAGALGTKVIRFAAVNIHHPDSPDPIPRTKDFNENDYPNGAQSEDLVFEIEDLKPTDSENVLIQVLTMSKDSTEGTMIFDYGDVSIRLKAGSNNASISLAEFTSASSSGVIAGRYMLSTNDGPSGTLIGSFNPPGNKPAMDVVKEEIFNGWFKAFMLPPGVGKFTWRLKETGQVLFDNIDTSSFSPSGTHLMKVAKAKSYRLRESVPEAAQDLFFGFFKHPSNTLDITSKKVCYLANNQAVPMHYTSAPGAAVPVPLIYDSTSDVIGGQSKNHAQLYANNECDIETDEYMSFHPSLLAERDGEALGMRGPFANMNPLIGENGYTRSDYDSTNTQITLKWQYLHGITDASVNGVTVYGKYLPGGSGGGGGGDDLSCDKRAEQKGLEHLGDVLRTNAPNNINEFNRGSIASISEAQDWRFMICPYKDLSTGERHYYSASIENHCRGNCQDIQNFGIGTLNYDMDTSGLTNFYGTLGGANGSLGGASVRIKSVATSSNYTTISNGGSAGSGTFNPGSELLLLVVGEKSNQCGSYDPGHFEFTTTLGVATSTGIGITIPKGTFIDNIPTSGLNAAATTSSFCYVQAVEVPHFQNLTISQDLNAKPFTYDDTGGGIVVFRVNGTLSIDNDITAVDAGFQKNAGANSPGDGAAGEDSLTGTGGEGASAGGAAGGGGFKQGVAGNAAGDFGDGFSSAESKGVLLSFGGAGGNRAAASGGHGAGAIFVVAKKIIANSGAIISHGENASGDGGGGGGGAVNVFADIIKKGTSDLSFDVAGGDGPGDGGDGGDGWLRYGYCSLENSVNFLGDSSAGNGGVNEPPMEQQPHFCD